MITLAFVGQWRDRNRASLEDDGPRFMSCVVLVPSKWPMNTRNSNKHWKFIYPERLISECRLYNDRWSWQEKLLVADRETSRIATEFIRSNAGHAQEQTMVLFGSCEDARVMAAFVHRRQSPCEPSNVGVVLGSNGPLEEDDTLCRSYLISRRSRYSCTEHKVNRSEIFFSLLPREVMV